VIVARRPGKWGKLQCDRSHAATARGSNRTHVPTLKLGNRPAAANLKIVTCETEKNFESSLAVRARPIFSIWSAIDINDSVWSGAGENLDGPFLGRRANSQIATNQDKSRFRHLFAKSDN
jgi:hypothetical protein